MQVYILYSTGKNGRINRQVKHDGANFFTGTAYCNEASDCKVKYKLSINRAIHEDNNGFIIIDVRKEGEHVHLEMKEQMRGNDRITIATECILTANGSANKFVNKKVGDMAAGENAAEINIEAEKVGKLRRIVSKSVKEFLNTEQVSNCV
jgi:hypothetical protein